MWGNNTGRHRRIFSGTILPNRASTRRSISEPGVRKAPARFMIVRSDGLFRPRSIWPMYVA